MRHGATGYAIYFHCLELIASAISETTLTFELEHDSEIIADNLKISGTHERSGREVVEEVMRYIIDLGLFQESGDKIFCFKLLKRLDASMTSNPMMRKIITDAKKNHDSVMTSHDPIMINHDPVMLDKIRLDQSRSEESKSKKPSSKRESFKPPSVEQVATYCQERSNRIDPQKFCDYYEAKGWKIGSTKMKDWKAAVRTWEGRTNQHPPKSEKTGISRTTFSGVDYGETTVGEI